MASLSSLPMTAAGLAIVGLASTPGVVAILTQIRRRTPKDNFYQDIDGKSSPEALAAFSNRPQKASILTLSAAGLGTSVASSTLSTVHKADHSLLLNNWLLTALWTLIFTQAASLGAHHSPVKVYGLGLWLFASCIVVSIVTLLHIKATIQDVVVYGDAGLILHAADVLIAVALGIGGILLPRRPEVFINNRPVDSQRSVSVINRFTWSWVRLILDVSTEKKDLDLDDVPEPDHTLRSDLLSDKWHAFNFRSPLLRSILWAYKGKIAISWISTAIRCLLAIGPYYTMLRLLRALEARESGVSITASELWTLVVSLGVFILAEQWADCFINWYCFAELTFPMRSQLSTLVFDKSLRRKNVKSTEKTDDDDDTKGETDTSVLKSRQAITNLVGVDTQRVSMFAAYQYMIVHCLAKLVIFSGFLVKLIGWIPFTSGILAWGLTLPCNFYVSVLLMRASENLMKVRDGKLAVVNEALLGMRQIKFSAVEAEWEKRILSVRESELKAVWKTFSADAVLFGCWVFGPILMAGASLVAYAAINGELTASVAFVSIGIFKTLEVTLSFLPELLTMGIDTLVSIRRLDTYLDGPELTKFLSEGSQPALKDASISWPVDTETPDEDRFILKDVNLTFPQGELSVISGKTGSGKSLLLAALLGEVDLLSGSIEVPRTIPPAERGDDNAHPGNWILPGSIAFVSQIPWLESASFRDNVLFGLPFIEDRYNQVLEACALKKDLGILTDGDRTELGANGINLSGGQKWRLTLARAVYSRAEILIMDDIFSAVDAHVGRRIFEDCISGELCHGRTRILVTHHVALVQPKTKYLVELSEGTVLHAGKVDELAEDGTLQEIRRHEQSEQEILQDEGVDSSTAVNSEEASIVDDAPTNNSKNTPEDPPENARQFIQEEKREKGMVKKHVYLSYFKSSGGWPLWGIYIFVFTGYQACILGRGWWLRIWTGHGQSNTSSVAADSNMEQGGYFSSFTLQQAMMMNPDYRSVQATAAKDNDLSFYLWVYITISTAAAVIGMVRYAWGFFMSIRASRAMFEKLLFTVLRTPLRWLDTVPVGRVLNRFTADFSTIDSRLTLDMSMFFSSSLSLVGVCVASFFISPLVMPLAIILVTIAFFISKRFMSGARPLRRLESNSRSPVFELFNAALAGVSTLRSFQNTHVYTSRMHSKVDKWNMINLYTWIVNRWMGFRMSLLGAVFSVMVGVVIISVPSMDAALAGFTLSFAVEFSTALLWTIRTYSNLELDMNAAERAIEYSELETEAIGGEKPPAVWPTAGTVEVENLQVAYAEDLPLVLKGVSFSVNNNERIGVVGRTGAGKSSLTLALFRFLEARSGSIIIDGVDISKIDLQILRSRLAIIPQDPVLFSGTIRYNLDPFDNYTDEQLRDSLARVHLVDPLADGSSSTVESSPSSATGSTIAPQNANIFHHLTSVVSESGGNLSQGQRQLLCLARAIVSRPKIMVLDEATSAVDMTTDAVIQRSIREEFTDSTLIVIAHRLSTIADFDRILVLNDGQVAEFGTPHDLWETEDGIFRDMCEHSGEKEKLRETIFGK